MHNLYVREGQSASLLIKLIYWRDRVTWALLSWENPSSVNQVEMLNTMERHSSLLSERRIWGFWAFWNCTNNNKHTVWCPLGMIQWPWCKTCFFMFGCLHVFIKFRVHKLRGEQLVILKLFVQFFHLGAINRQRMRLTTPPTPQGRKAKALFLNVRQHMLKK